MPRKSRAKTKSESPAGLSPDEAVTAQYEKLAEQVKPLAELREQIPSLTTAAELAPPEREVTQPAPEQARPRPSHDRNGSEHELPKSHVDAVLARRPKFDPVPDNFMNVLRDEAAGIRVNKSHDRAVAAIQFASDRTPDRAEKDILEAVGKPEDGRNFTYRTERKQWERRVPEGMEMGENTIDAARVAKELAQGREGRGR